jgi:hypothetical protein
MFDSLVQLIVNEPWEKIIKRYDELGALYTTDIESITGIRYISGISTSV